MRKTREMRRIEAETNQDIRDYLIALYTKHGNLARVSQELGLTQGTLSRWMERLDIPTRHTVDAGELMSLVNNHE